MGVLSIMANFKGTDPKLEGSTQPYVKGLYTLECCRCKARYTVNQTELDRLERESEVALCEACRG